MAVTCLCPCSCFDTTPQDLKMDLSMCSLACRKSCSPQVFGHRKANAARSMFDCERRVESRCEASLPCSIEISVLVLVLVLPLLLHDLIGWAPSSWLAVVVDLHVLTDASSTEVLNNESPGICLTAATPFTLVWETSPAQWEPADDSHAGWEPRHTSCARRCTSRPRASNSACVAANARCPAT